MDQGYWQKYWTKNRGRILAARKAKYEGDESYRTAVIERAKDRYWKVRSKKAVVQKEVPKRVREASRTLRPRPCEIGGEVALVHHIAELARRCKVSPETLKIWEDRKVIPPPTMLDDGGRRWYSIAYIEALEGVVELHWNSVKGLEDFGKLVKTEFERRKVAEAD